MVMRGLRVLGALLALGVFATSAYLLLTASPLLAREAIAVIGLPLGNLVVWAGIFALPLACYLGFYGFLFQETRTSRLFRYGVKALLALSAAWGVVCFGLAGNWAYNFDGGSGGFQGSVDAAMAFWVYSVSIVGLSLLVAGLLLVFSIAAARNRNPDRPNLADDSQEETVNGQ